MMRLALLLLLDFLIGSCARPHDRATVDDVEAHLLAPCCWMQTLDVHESPLATELRDEVTARVGRGETAERIEDDLARRYGERIRALHRGDDLRWLPIAAILGALLGVGGAALIGRRWVRRRPAPTAAAAPRGHDRYEDLLDDELDELDAKGD